MTRRCIGLFLLSIAGAAQAQDGADLLSAYRRAESYLPHNIVELASDLAVHPYWSSDGQFFWYRRERCGGWDYVRVNIADGTRVSSVRPRKAHGWPHLQLIDAVSGRKLRQLTQGAWSVLFVPYVDAAASTIFFVATGREPGRDPYLRHLYRIARGGGELRLLTPEPMDHEIHWQLQLVGALIDANKDFDLLILPNQGHFLDESAYYLRRQWDFFVRHLLHAAPPAGYAISPFPASE